MDRSIIKKEQIIKEFKEELILKKIKNWEEYDPSFFLVLNNLYQYKPEIFRANINRLENLTFLIKIDHSFIYLEILNKDLTNTLLSINKMTENFDDCGIYNLSLNNSIKKIKELWMQKI